jgi:hypothetical protein
MALDGSALTIKRNASMSMHCLLDMYSSKKEYPMEMGIRCRNRRLKIGLRTRELSYSMTI